MSESTPRAEGPTAWQRAQAERQADQAGEAGPASEPDALTGAKRAELLRCAEAFERTAARLREIVGTPGDE